MDEAPPNDLVLYRLMLVSGFVAQEFARRFAKDRLTLQEWRVLLELHRQGPDSAAAVARRTGLSAMNVSRAVAALLDARRVERAPDPADGRRQRLALTARGRALVARILPEGEALERTLLDAVRPEDRPALSAALLAMLERVRAVAAEVRTRTGPRKAPPPR